MDALQARCIVPTTKSTAINAEQHPRQYVPCRIPIPLRDPLADLATGYLINASERGKHQQLNEQLQHALDSRIIIEQAKGMVAAIHHVSVQAAVDLIRGHARRHHAFLRSVAEAVMNLGLRIEAGPEPPGGGS